MKTMKFVVFALMVTVVAGLHAADEAVAPVQVEQPKVEQAPVTQPVQTPKAGAQAPVQAEQKQAEQPTVEQPPVTQPLQTPKAEVPAQTPVQAEQKEAKAPQTQAEQGQANSDAPKNTSNVDASKNDANNDQPNDAELEEFFKTLQDQQGKDKDSQQQAAK